MLYYCINLNPELENNSFTDVRETINKNQSEAADGK